MWVAQNAELLGSEENNFQTNFGRDRERETERERGVRRSSSLGIGTSLGVN